MFKKPHLRAGALVASCALLACKTGCAQGQRVDESAIRYVIDARLLPDSDVVIVRSQITVPASALSIDGDLVLRAQIGISRAFGRPIVEAIQFFDDHGSRLTTRPGADSATMVVHVPLSVGSNPSAVVVTTEYREPFDSSDLRQLGYYLFPATSANDAWYPDVSGLPDSVSRFRDFDVTLTYPRGWAVLTSGIEQTSDSSPTIVRSRYRAQHIEGFALAVGNGYSIATTDRDGVRILAFAPPALSDKLRSVAEAAADAIAWYRHAYGFFPVAQLGIVPGAERASGGFPMSNLFMIHRGDLSADFIRWITAHELGHYYWGLYTLDPAERLGWLMLANSIWADHLFLAQHLGISLREAWRIGVQSNSFLDFAVAQAGNYEQRLGILRPVEDSLAFDYNSLVRHGKASVGVYLLARRIGADSFLSVQRRILADYRYRVLPESAFVARLTQAGVIEAQAFVDAWRRGDARLGYTIISVRADAAARKNTYQVVVRRTGTVSAAVDVEVRSRSGQVVHHTFAGVADEDTVTVRLDAPLADASLDAAGELPMWESANPDIRRLFIRALYEAGHRDAFLQLAVPWLRAHHDVELRALAIMRLFDLSHFDQVVALTRSVVDSLDCSTRTTCRATILVARALGYEGRTVVATRLLDRIHSRVAEFAAQQRWDLAREEIRGIARH